MPLVALIKTNWRLVALLALCSTCLALGWHWRGVAYQAAEAEQLRQLANARRKQEEEGRQASAGLQAYLAALESKNRDLSRKLTHELKNPGYDCPLPPGGLQLRRDALDPAAE